MPSIQPGNSKNVVTEFKYGPGGRLEALIAKNPETGDQVTRYEYGVSPADGSDLASNDLLRAEIYPDSSDSLDRVSYTYNRQGQRTTMRDQNGTVHEYAYDGLGRQTADSVTTVGAGVDDAVLRIGQSYEVRGMVEKVTSYSDAAGTTPVNEVENAYNSFAQLVTQYQEHAGAVNTGTTPKVEYDYEGGSANTIRPTSMTYPSGQVLEYLYDDDSADNLSRIRTLNWDGTDVCRYSYLGLGTFVTTDYLQPQVKLDYALGSGTNPYTGFDRFGRIIDLLWQKYNTSSSSSSSSSEAPPGLVHLQYGYDRASNRTFREDLIAQWYDKDFDELYEYDGMHRLAKFHRGRLTDNRRTITSPTLQQGWVLDATGNWRNFTQNDQVDADQTLDQQRIANRVNEITQIARTVGSNWVTPEYDRNGNMTVIPQPKQPTLPYRGTWDAWNRMVKLEEPDGDGGWQNMQENSYDGQSWRIVREAFISGVSAESRAFYYSFSWCCLEERAGVSTTPNRYYVWGDTYIDALILRDLITDSDDILNQRLYAIQDVHWNIVSVTTTIGVVEERYIYTAYGHSTVTNPSFVYRNASFFEWETRFSGSRQDLQVEILLARLRYYIAELGWCSRDVMSVAPFNNLYDVLRANPLSYVDPSGLVTIASGGGYRIVVNWETAHGVPHFHVEQQSGRRWVTVTRLGANFQPLPGEALPPRQVVRNLIEPNRDRILEQLNKLAEWMEGQKKIKQQLEEARRRLEANPNRRKGRIDVDQLAILAGLARAIAP